MTKAWLEANLPVIDGIIVWPQLADGIQVETQVDAFLALFSDVPDDINALKEADLARNTGFGKYLDAIR